MALEGELAAIIKRQPKTQTYLDALPNGVSTLVSARRLHALAEPKK